jgi:enoyl-[acyl-carrier protein] reductase/trans-2-enoyl-CoA reductase (NAD+)
MSTLAVVKPKVRGFVCVTSHPAGCAAHVREQIAHVQAQPPLARGPKKALIIGASTGYGLASRIAAAFGARAATLGVFFERPSEKGRPASAGWYNTVAFEQAARAEGLYAKSINGDAFSEDIKLQTIARLKEDLGPVDLVIYSLASPRRTDPRSGEVYKSVLKPVGAPFTAKTVDTDKKEVLEITLEPATAEDIRQTTKTMGGEDWEMWLDALRHHNLLAPGVVTVAYSYIGPEVTYAIYRNGTIGKAKEDLENTAARLTAKLAELQGRAWVSVNKAVVTQASSAIPVVPLYLAILLKVMAEKKVDEGCIEQIQRLFATLLYRADGANAGPTADAAGRLRVDDWEMRPDVQDAVKKIWPQVTTANLNEITAFPRYQAEFLKLFGFGFPGVNYDAEVELEVGLE